MMMMMMMMMCWGLGIGGLQGLKPKAGFLMLLCCEHDLQGLGFPVGAPKTFFVKMVMMMMMKPKADFLMLLCCEHDLQGLGFPVGAPKPSFSKC